MKIALHPANFIYKPSIFYKFHWNSKKARKCQVTSNQTLCILCSCYIVNSNFVSLDNNINNPSTLSLYSWYWIWSKHAHTYEDPTVYQRLRTNQISSSIENELELNFQKIPLKMIFEIMQNLSLKSGWMNKYLMDIFPG